MEKQNNVLRDAKSNDDGGNTDKEKTDGNDGGHNKKTIDGSTMQEVLKNSIGDITQLVGESLGIDSMKETLTGLSGIEDRISKQISGAVTRLVPKATKSDDSGDETLTTFEFGGEKLSGAELLAIANKMTETIKGNEVETAKRAKENKINSIDTALTKAGFMSVGNLMARSLAEVVTVDETTGQLIANDVEILNKLTQVKGRKTVPFSEYLQQLAIDNPNLVKDVTKKGSGGSDVGAGGSGNDVNQNPWNPDPDKFSLTEQVEIFNSNPDTAKRLAKVYGVTL